MLLVPQAFIWGRLFPRCLIAESFFSPIFLCGYGIQTLWVAVMEISLEFHRYLWLWISGPLHRFCVFTASWIISKVQEVISGPVSSSIPVVLQANSTDTNPDVCWPRPSVDCVCVTARYCSCVGRCHSTQCSEEVWAWWPGSHSPACTPAFRVESKCELGPLHSSNA